MKFKENHGEVDDDDDETHMKEPPKATLNLHPPVCFTRSIILNLNTRAFV